MESNSVCIRVNKNRRSGRKNRNFFQPITIEEIVNFIFFYNCFLQLFVYVYLLCNVLYLKKEEKTFVE